MSTKDLSNTLSQQEKKFADRYLICRNASQAAREAGYATRSAGVAGNRLLKRPRVQVYLAHLAEKRSRQEVENPSDEVTLQTKVMQELNAMAFANIADFITIDDDGVPQVDFSKASPEQLRAITEVASKRTVTKSRDGSVTETADNRFKMADKYRGLELIMRATGMLKPEEHKVTVDVADRLLAARARLRAIQDGEAE